MSPHASIPTTLMGEQEPQTELAPKSIALLRPGIGGFFAGVGSVFWGLRKILQDGKLRKLAVVPLLVTMLLYIILVVAGFFFADDLLGLLWDRPASGWFMLSLWYLAVVVLVVSLLIMLGLLFTLAVETIGGPFYDKMAVRILAAHDIPVREPGFIEGTIPDLFRILFFLIPTIICSAIGLIPIVGVPFAVAGAIIAALGLASAAINPALLITGHGVWTRLGYVFRSFSAMMGIGGVVAAALVFLPIVGLIVIPSSIVGAAHLYAKRRTQA